MFRVERLNRTEEREEKSTAFSTEPFGFETENPVIRVLDWRPKWRTEAHLVRSIRSYIKNGARSRRERFTEIGGRVSSGYFREPQSELHIHSPLMSPAPEPLSEDPIANWKNFLNSRVTQKNLDGLYKHRAYLMLDVPEIRMDSYKKRFYVIPDSVPVEQRKIKAVFLREELISPKTLETIKKLCAEANWAVFDIASLGVSEKSD